MFLPDRIVSLFFEDYIAVWYVLSIPVLVTTDSSSNGYYGSSSNVIGIQHDLKPGYVRLKGGLKGEEKDSQGNPVYPENILKLEVVSTNFGSTKAK